MGMVTLRLWRRGAETLAVRYLGKLATFLLYGAVPAFYLAAADVAPTFFRTVGWITGIAGLVLYWFVAFQYTGDARAVLVELESASKVEES